MEHFIKTVCNSNKEITVFLYTCNNTKKDNILWVQLGLPFASLVFFKFIFCLYYVMEDLDSHYMILGADEFALRMDHFEYTHMVNND